MKAPVSAASKVHLIVEAVLDSYTSSPAFVLDDSGRLCVNSVAQQLINDGQLSVAEIERLPTDAEVTINGQALHVRRRELNHGTNAILTELRVCDEHACRIRSASKMLEAVLKRV